MLPAAACCVPLRITNQRRRPTRSPGVCAGAGADAQLYKLASSGLCAGVPGQIMTSLMVSPPKPGDASFESHTTEEIKVFGSLQRRSKLLVDGLNAIPGIDCEPADGAMYAFPRVELPRQVFVHAAANNTSPDTVYALSLLESTGICVVPATGFGQAPGRVGFRTTFTPPEEELEIAVQLIAEHHARFCDEWSSK